MNAYEMKQAERKQYLLLQADKARKDFEEKHEKAHHMASAIPFGQPIHVGHHSERADRNYRDRIHNSFGKAFAALDKAQDYERKANAVGTGGISSDDPEAHTKLCAELASREQAQERMKAVNAAIRRGKTEEQRFAALIAIGLQEEEASLLLTPDCMGWIGYPPYKLSNNNGNIHRIKTRIASLEKLAGREAKEIKSKIYVYKENPDINRVMFFFDGKPALYIRDLLKSRGFKWSPRLGAWVRHLNNAGLYAVREVIAKLDLD